MTIKRDIVFAASLYLWLATIVFLVFICVVCFCVHVYIYIYMQGDHDSLFIHLLEA